LLAAEGASASVFSEDTNDDEGPEVHQRQGGLIGAQGDLLKAEYRLNELE
jgi:hypothetical protein